MRLNLTSLLLLTCIASFTSCKKDKEVVTEPIKRVKMLSRIIEVVNDKVIFTTFEYDDKSRLIAKKRNSGTQTFYKYEGNNLYFTESFTGNTKQESIITYENGRPSIEVLKIYTDGALTLEYTFSCVYSGDKLTELHGKKNGQVFNIQKVQFVGNNEVRNELLQDGHVFLQEFTYDDKKNKFHNSPLSYRTYLEGGERYNSNNVLYTKGSLDGIVRGETKYTYTYDAEGFPITLVVKSTNTDGSDAGTFKYTYEYVML